MTLYFPPFSKLRLIELLAILLLLPFSIWGAERMALEQEVEGVSLPAHNLTTFFHDDVHAQIDQLTQQIELEPGNPNLYYRRASLYHAHGSFAEGLNDYQQALQLGYDQPDIYYFMARLYRELKEPELSFSHIDIFMEKTSGEKWIAGLIERARIYASFGRSEEAVADYQKALHSEGIATIDHYLELTEVTLQLRPDHPEDAVAVLDRGIAKLGALPVLQLKAIELEQQAGRIEEAAARMDTMMKNMARRESYYFRKAEMLRASGAVEAARENYHLAKEALEALPLRHKNTKAMQELLEKIDAALLIVGQ